MIVVVGTMSGRWDDEWSKNSMACIQGKVVWCVCNGEAGRTQRTKKRC